MKSSLHLNPDTNAYVPVCYPQAFRFTRIIVFEFFASLIFTLGVMVSYNGQHPNVAYISLAMFMAFVISGQLSGGQGNPIITLALLFTKGSNVNLRNCLIYISSQFVGAITAGAIAYGTVTNYYYPCRLGPQEDTALAAEFGGELLGSFVFIILYLIIMSASTKMESNFWSYILVPCAFYIAKMITVQYAGLNPSTVLANEIFYGVKYSDFSPMNNYREYIIGPSIGCLAATLFFNYFLLPIHQKWVRSR